MRVCALVVGEAEALYLFHLRGALIGAVQGKEGYRVDALVEPDALQEETYWVLPEETVEEGDLADLENGEYVRGDFYVDNVLERRSRRTCLRNQ